MRDGMTKTEEFLFGIRDLVDTEGKPITDKDGVVQREIVTPEEIELNLGIVPQPESIRRVLNKLHRFGALGVEGFAQAIATYSIMRNEKEHEVFPLSIDGVVEQYKRPFTFVEPADDSKQSDQGKHAGYTYGLNIIGREMTDIRMYDFKANSMLRLIAENRKTEQALIAHKVSSSEEINESLLEFGYSKCYPDNAESVAGYLVLPRPDAIEIVQEAALQELV